MRKVVKRFAAIFMAFAVTFTSLPMLSGSLDVSAASYFKTLNSKAVTQSSATIYWTKLTKKQQKKVSGIAVFRNGVAIKRLKKTATIFTDTKLKAGTSYKYQIKTYKTKKQKQWYNKATGKWQKKKPAKKNRGKSRKVTVYTYKNASPAKVVKTKAKATAAASSSSSSSTSSGSNTTSGTSSGSSTSGNSGSTSSGSTNSGSTTSTSKLVEEDTTTYVDFMGVQVHYGQAWTTALSNQLKSKADGTFTFTRPEGYYTGKPFNTYLYNTNSYDPFLAVYVEEGQITGWCSNAEVLSVWKGQELKRGENAAAYPETASNSTNIRIQCMYVTANNNICALIAVGGNNCTFTNESDARTAGYHFINAARVGYGINPLKRSKYLEGVDLDTGKTMTWTGTIPDGAMGSGIKGGELVNQRYGAQAWAETEYASVTVAHSGLTKGPLGTENKPYDYWTDNTWTKTVRRTVEGYASDKKMLYTGENCSTGGGEACLFSYIGSQKHLGQIFAESNKSVGVGVCTAKAGGSRTAFHCVQFSDMVE